MSRDFCYINLIEGEGSEYPFHMPSATFAWEISPLRVSTTNPPSVLSMVHPVHPAHEACLVLSTHLPRDNLPLIFFLSAKMVQRLSFRVH